MPPGRCSLKRPQWLGSWTRLGGFLGLERHSNKTETDSSSWDRTMHVPLLSQCSLVTSSLVTSSLVTMVHSVQHDTKSNAVSAARAQSLLTIHPLGYAAGPFTAARTAEISRALNSGRQFVRALPYCGGSSLSKHSAPTMQASDSDVRASLAPLSRIVSRNLLVGGGEKRRSLLACRAW